MRASYVLAGLPFLMASAAMAADRPQPLDLAQLDAVTAGAYFQNVGGNLASNPNLGLGVQLSDYRESTQVLLIAAAPHRFAPPQEDTGGTGGGGGGGTGTPTDSPYSFASSTSASSD